jgi:hypothetical protein
MSERHIDMCLRLFDVAVRIAQDEKDGLQGLSSGGIERTAGNRLTEHAGSSERNRLFASFLHLNAGRRWKPFGTEFRQFFAWLGIVFSLKARDACLLFFWSC